MMLNLHLLQTDLNIDEYKAMMKYKVELNPKSYLNRLPAYMIAYCPFCLIKNIERLDTYSVRTWSRDRAGRAVFDPYAVTHHCEHFTLVEPFFHFHGIWPDEAKGLFGPEKPCVKAHLLQSGQCLAVIHALPVCRIENDSFVPRYTLFMVSYFSMRPNEAYNAVIAFNLKYTDEPYTPSPFLGGCSDDFGEDLSRWVSAGQLYWVDGSDPALSLRTHDTEAFPYGGIIGRTYSHRFPYPLPGSRTSKIQSKI